MAKSTETLSLEGHITGRMARELEYTFYGLLKDMNQLNQAAEKEDHEQWRLPLANDDDGRRSLRLRLINHRRYTMTSKIRRDGVLGQEEVENDISEAMFKHLKESAFDGYNKVRYNFPIAGTDRKWEIDVFFDRMGKPHPWVKIDLEVNTPEDPIPEFPLELERFIVNNSPKQTMAEKAFVRKLWQSEWQRIDAVAVAGDV